jgi:hypothetical protein
MLKLKAMRICASKEDDAKSARSLHSVDEIGKDPKDISG